MIGRAVKQGVRYRSRLSPAAWKGEKLRPDVSLALMRAAKLFIGSLDIPDFKMTDLVLTGSMANYNYTRYSDFDLHIITRYSDLDCDDLAEAFYQAKKTIWNHRHDIRINGHEVEVYVEDINEPPVAAGIYSILKDTWVRRPEYDPPDIDRNAVRAKVSQLAYYIDRELGDSNSPEDVERLINKIRKMRQSGLARGGEFSVENLAFKVLRNMGYTERLYQEFTARQDKEISI